MLSSEFEVSLEGPIDFAASLAIFRRSGDDMIDRYDGTWLVRTTRVDRRAVAYACRPTGDVERPRLSVTVASGTEAPLGSKTVPAMGALRAWF